MNRVDGSHNHLSVLACQVEVPAMTTAQDRDRHVRRLASAIGARLSQQPADLVVLPELSTIDYSRAAFERLDHLAEPIDGPSFRTFSVLAREHNTHLLYGMPRTHDGKVLITAVLINPEGEYGGHYDKLHLAQFGDSMEREFFVAGDHLHVFEINGIRIAPIICYDIRMPELIRTLALRHDVQLILHCGAYTRDPTFYSWRPFVVTRALENRVIILSLNRAGDRWGSSVFCPPFVDEQHRELVFGAKEELRYLEVSTTTIDAAREIAPFVEDRLDSYADLPLLDVTSAK